MTRMMHVENIGLVENMAYFECPDCGKKVNLFGEQKGAKFAEAMDLDFLGELPFRSAVSEAADIDETPIVKSDPECEAAQEFMKIAQEIKEKYMDE